MVANTPREGKGKIRGRAPARRQAPPEATPASEVRRVVPRGRWPRYRIPGSIPFMPRSIFCMPPLATIFIIFCVCSNWFRS